MKFTYIIISVETGLLAGYGWRESIEEIMQECEWYATHRSDVVFSFAQHMSVDEMFANMRSAGPTA